MERIRDLTPNEIEWMDQLEHQLERCTEILRVMRGNNDRLLPSTGQAINNLYYQMLDEDGKPFERRDDRHSLPNTLVIFSKRACNNSCGRISTYMTPHAIVTALVLEMEADNNSHFYPKPQQFQDAMKFVDLMKKQGCFFTEGEISLLASGECTDVENYFSRYLAFNDLNKVLNEVFNNEEVAGDA